MVFLVRRGSYTIFNIVKIRKIWEKKWKIRKTWSMNKKGHQKFLPWKWEFFPKKASFRNLGPRKNFPSPKLGARSPSLTGWGHIWIPPPGSATDPTVGLLLMTSLSACTCTCSLHVYCRPIIQCRWHKYLKYADTLLFLFCVDAYVSPYDYLFSINYDIDIVVLNKMYVS